MAIHVGDRMPDGAFTTMTPQGPVDLSARDLFDGRIVVLFAVPGAFTPTCSQKHLPTYLEEHDRLKAGGVDTIACLAVNDVHVMHAWGTANAVGDRILMLADGSATYTRAIGMDQDISRFGMGIRSRRYAMLVRDGIVEVLNVDAPGQFKVSGAAEIACRF